MADRAQKIKSIFAKYDKNGDGTIEIEELSAVLKALGGFQNVEIQAIFDHMDRNHDGAIDFEEFVDWLFNSQQDARAKAALMPGEDGGLKSVFYSFCGAGQAGMDGKSFAKMCKDVKLVDRGMTPTDVDLIFAKVVKKGQRRMVFAEFEAGLRLIAEKKRMSEEDIRDRICVAGGPSLQGTKTDNVRFHDDKSTYTGMHQGKGDLRAGLRSPSPLQGSAPLKSAGAAAVARRAPGRSVSPTPAAASPTPAAASPSRVAAASPSRAAAAEKDLPAEGVGSNLTLLDSFKTFCKPNLDMDGKTFAKVCRDTGLIDKKFTPTDVDLAFAKNVPKGMRRIGYHQFEELLEYVATKKGLDFDDLRRMVVYTGGPVLNGTVADNVRFHDDKSTYTGTHINGGPERVAVGHGTATQLASRGMRIER